MSRFAFTAVDIRLGRQAHHQVGTLFLHHRLHVGPIADVEMPHTGWRIVAKDVSGNHGMAAVFQGRRRRRGQSAASSGD